MLQLDYFNWLNRKERVSFKLIKLYLYFSRIEFPLQVFLINKQNASRTISIKLNNKCGFFTAFKKKVNVVSDCFNHIEIPLD